jgi:gamma-glutamyl hydrolase
MTLFATGYGVNPDSFTTDKALSEFYRLTSVSYEPSTGKPFGTSIEAYNYPFYGTQFHPEKVLDLFTDNSGINHSWESIHYNRFFADQFMTFARQNTNTWGDYSEVQKAIIANCRLVVTDTWGGEVYAFSSTEGCIP